MFHRPAPDHRGGAAKHLPDALPDVGEAAERPDGDEQDEGEGESVLDEEEHEGGEVEIGGQEKVDGVGGDVDEEEAGGEEEAGTSQQCLEGLW